MQHNGQRFSASALEQWIFPDSTKYPPRPYQLQICEKALFNNTLVCLPTGLGKTLIAAVVMYNYYRWYPSGIIVFMAPTKPLVDQQISACSDIVGIPGSDTSQLTGTISAEERAKLWTQRRVFFCTPQTLTNDLINGICDPRKIVCIVIDEAHRATANYAYTTAVEHISRYNSNFRILALSATPGTNARDIQNVIHNLHISHVEMRCEEDNELAPYIHHRLLETILCECNPTAEPKFVMEQINELMRSPLRVLHANGITTCDNANNLNIFVIQDAEKAILRERASDSLPMDLEDHLTSLLAELRSWMQCKKILRDDGESSLLSALRKMQEFDADIPDGSSLRSPVFGRLLQYLSNKTISRGKGQAKVVKLKEILSEHFLRHQRANSSTRALIFCNTRETVNAIVNDIEDLQHVKPHAFVGQSTRKLAKPNDDGRTATTQRGLKQAEQIGVLKLFNEGVVNVLVATSVAEEGLDIAEVDLIVFFDVVSSPIRQVQREGRTARKRAGRVVVLASNKAEAEKIEKSSEQSANISKALKNASTSMKLYTNSPRMIPSHLTLPRLHVMNLSVAKANQNLEDSRVRPSFNHEPKKKDNSSNFKIDQFFQSASVLLEKGGVSGPVGSNNNGYSRVHLREITASTLNAGSEYDRSNNNYPKSIAQKCSTSDFSTRIQASVFAADELAAESKAPSYSNSASGLMKKKNKQGNLFDWNFATSSSSKGKDFPAQKNSVLEFTTKTDTRSRNDAVRYESNNYGFNYSNNQSYDNSKKSVASSSVTKQDSNFFAQSTAFQYSIDDDDENVSDVIDITDETEEAGNQSFRKISMATECHSNTSQDRRDSVNSLPRSTQKIIATFGLQNALSSIKQTVRFLPSSSDSSSDEDETYDAVEFKSKKSSAAVVSSSEKAITSFDNDTSDVPEYIDSIDFGNESDYKPSSRNENKIYNQEKSSRRSRIVVVDEDDEEESNSDAEDDDEVASLESKREERRTTADEDAQCAVCMDPDAAEDDPIIFCDGSCNTCVHKSCYGLEKVPEGNFYCEPCSVEVAALKQNHVRPKPPRCVLCFRSGDLLKKSVCGKWVHSICVLYTPELRLDIDTKRAANLGKLDSERNSLTCSICNRSGGACVQCEVKECLESFHPYCCYHARYQMVTRSSKRNDNIYEIYCRKHRNSVRHPKTVTSSRNSLRQHKSKPDHPSKKAPASSSMSSNQLSNLTTNRSQKRKSKSNKAARFFELEAAEVVSDCDEENIDDAQVKSHVHEDDEDEHEADDSGILSGSFINDGEYTQRESIGGGSGGKGQQSMYLAINRRQMEVDSPDDERLIFKKSYDRFSKADDTIDESFVVHSSPSVSFENANVTLESPFDANNNWWQQSMPAGESVLSDHGIAMDADPKSVAGRLNRLQPNSRKNTINIIASSKRKAAFLCYSSSSEGEP